LKCPECTSDKITLIDHINKLNEINIPTTTQFLHIRSAEKLWILTPRGIVIAGEDGSIINSYSFDVDVSANCVNWLQWDNVTIIVICRNKTEQFFLLVTNTPNYDNVQNIPIKQQISIDFWVNSVLKIAGDGNHLLLLDNDGTVDAKGTVFVFKFTNIDTVKITGERVLKASDFGSMDSDKINDFELLPTSLTNSSMMMVTLNEYGLGYGVFNLSGEKFVF
jgi:hypothetical protein